MAFQENFESAFAELQGDTDLDPDPRSGTKQREFSWLRMDKDTEKYKPPKDEMQDYWRAFETVPFIRQSITSFAREVVEPGWFIEAESDETAEELAQWMRSCAITEGQKGNDFLMLAKKSIIQREVRGTVMIEHVPDRTDRDSIAALKLINPETVTVFTKPDTTLLWDPDDNAPNSVPRTDDGDVAAYVQFYNENKFPDRDMNPFAQDDITKITRDADVGEIYGTSRIEAVLPRVESLRQKLSDLDASIENKAWPAWIFQFGTEDNPWHPDEISDFMQEQDEENFTPGTKQGVQGDIGVETVGGDVPDIEYSIKYDINHILSIMPMPKAATGFAEDVNQFVTRFQNERIRRQVREARRELEHEFQDILEMKAEELGLDDEGLQLRIAPPGGAEPADYEERGTTIRYISDVDDDGNGDGSNNASEGDPHGDRPDPGEQGTPTDANTGFDRE